MHFCENIQSSDVLTIERNLVGKAFPVVLREGNGRKEKNTEDLLQEKCRRANAPNTPNYSRPLV
jgi:hypothetical protein